MSDNLTRRDFMGITIGAGVAAFLAGCGITQKRATQADLEAYERLDLGDYVLPTEHLAVPDSLYGAMRGDSASIKTLVFMDESLGQYRILSRNWELLLGESQLNIMGLAPEHDKDLGRKQREVDRRYQLWFEENADVIGASHEALYWMANFESRMPVFPVDPVRELDKKVEGLHGIAGVEGRYFMTQYKHRITALEDNLDALIACPLTEGMFTELVALESFRDRLEGRRTGNPFIPAGEALIKTDDEIAAAYKEATHNIRHQWERKGLNHLAKIVYGERIKVIGKLWDKFVPEKISLKALTGGTYYTDREIARLNVEYGGKHALLWGVLTCMSAAPYVGLIPVSTEVLPTIFRRDELAQDKDLRKYHDVVRSSILHLYGGESGRNHPGKKDDAILYGILALTTTALAAYPLFRGHSHRSSASDTGGAGYGYFSGSKDMMNGFGLGGPSAAR